MSTPVQPIVLPRHWCRYDDEPCVMCQDVAAIAALTSRDTGIDVIEVFHDQKGEWYFVSVPGESMEKFARRFNQYWQDKYGCQCDVANRHGTGCDIIAA